jgi:HEAT repeat protein
LAEEVRFNAAVAMIGDSDVARSCLAELISASEDPSHRVRLAALLSIVSIDSEMARWWAPKIPAQFGPQPQADTFEELNALQRRNPRVIDALTDSLSSNNDSFVKSWFSSSRPVSKAYLPLLVARLSHSNAVVRANTAKALSYLGDRDAVPQLERLYRDPAWGTRLEAAVASVTFSNYSQSTITVLEEAFRRPGELDRIKAAIYLGLCGPKADSATGSLILALKDRYHRVRIYAADALWKINQDSSNEGLAALIELISQPGMDSPWLMAAVVKKWGRRAAAAVPAMQAQLDALSPLNTQSRNAYLEAIRFISSDTSNPKPTEPESLKQ